MLVVENFQIFSVRYQPSLAFVPFLHGATPGRLSGRLDFDQVVVIFENQFWMFISANEVYHSWNTDRLHHG